MRLATLVPPRPRLPRLLFLALLTATASLPAQRTATEGGHGYNSPYAGRHLDRVAFPIGGIGAGMICLEGTGGISHVSVRNCMQFFHEPCSFAALCIKDTNGNVAKVLEGPVPTWKAFGAPRTGNGAGGTSYGLPRFDAATFTARFPFATVTLADAEIPLDVEITGWSPFVPGEADDSSLPTGALEYRFTNRGAAPVQAVFSYHSKQFMATGRGSGRVLPIAGGFVLHQEGSDKNPAHEGSYAVFVDGEATVDHCWFHGGWWDALTLVWRNVERGSLVANPPTQGSAPGASLYVPLTIAPGETRCVRLMLCWYVPETDLRYGKDEAASGPAFGYGPSADPERRHLQNLFTAHQTIAAGGKMIMWFIGGPTGRDARQWDDNHDLVRIAAQLRHLYRELMRIGLPYAIYSTPVTRTHDDKPLEAPAVPRWSKPFPPDFPVQPVLGEAMFGFYHDDDRRAAFYVANHNAYAPQRMALEVGSAGRQVIQRLDRATGEWVELDSSDGRVSFELGPAAGELFRVSD